MDADLLIVGDLVPQSSAVARLPFDCPLIGNLEGPILDDGHPAPPIGKAGPHLKGAAIPPLAPRSFVSLANNHLMDYGSAGLATTTAYLDAREIRYCGAGASRQSAEAPTVIDFGPAAVGFVACCESQFGMAGESSAGCAPFGPWLLDAVSGLRRRCDHVVVSFHAGLEISPWPSPQLRAVYRQLIEAGAAIVHGHHPHSPQGVERHGRGLILYGLGNFLVDPRRWARYPHGCWSLGVAVSLTKTGFDYRILQFETSLDDVGAIAVEEVDGELPDDRRRYLRDAQRPLDEPLLLQAVWQEASSRAYAAYYRAYIAQSVPRVERTRGFVRRLRSRIGRIVRSAPKRQAAAVESGDQAALLYHLYACMSHRDAIATALGMICGEIADVRTSDSADLASRYLAHIQ